VTNHRTGKCEVYDAAERVRARDSRSKDHKGLRARQSDGHVSWHRRCGFCWDEVRGVWHANKFGKLSQRKETAGRPHHSCGSVISVSSPSGDATAGGVVLIGNSGPVEGVVATGMGSGPEEVQQVASEA
jgi:hypothetical protein